MGILHKPLINITLFLHQTSRIKLSTTDFEKLLLLYKTEEKNRSNHVFYMMGIYRSIEVLSNLSQDVLL